MLRSVVVLVVGFCALQGMYFLNYFHGRDMINITLYTILIWHLHFKRLQYNWADKRYVYPLWHYGLLSVHVDILYARYVLRSVCITTYKNKKTYLV